MNNLYLDEAEAILFDLSGTLVNDLLAGYNGYVDLCKKYNTKPPSLIQFREDFKLPYPDFLSEKGFKEIEDAIYFWKNAYMNYGSLIIKFSDVIPTLEKLKKHDSIKLGVVSQTPKEQVEQNLKKFNLQNYFDNIVLDRLKPKPKGLLQALVGSGNKKSQKRHLHRRLRIVTSNFLSVRMLPHHLDHKYNESHYILESGFCQ